VGSNPARNYLIRETIQIVEENYKTIGNDGSILPTICAKEKRCKPMT